MFHDTGGPSTAPTCWQPPRCRMAVVVAHRAVVEVLAFRHHLVLPSGQPQWTGVTPKHSAKPLWLCGSKAPVCHRIQTFYG